MKKNPFASHASMPKGDEPHAGQNHERASGAANAGDGEPSDGEFASPQKRNRFLQLAGSASVIFLVLVFLVFREIAHNRELYQMSRMVAAAEAQKQFWKERHRLDEARAAALMAELLRQQSSSRDNQVIKANYVRPVRAR